MKAQLPLILCALLISVVYGCRTAGKPDATNAAKQPSQPKYRETEITFVSDSLELYGTLDLPVQRKGKVPAVVLVHGSGPNDRDETLAAMKPFQDIGRGLAEHGIAVLRYDKRTFTYGLSYTQQQLVNLTVKEEVLDDALAAVRFLRGRSEIDSEKLFILGHSLGGWAAPLIAKQDPEIAGIIMLAPSAADFDQTFIRQVKYRVEVGGIPKDTADKLIAETKQGFADLRSGKFPDDRILLGASGKYWKDFLRRDPVSTVTTLPQPVLILQGDKDYQVTTKDDLPIWEKALKGSGKANYRIVRFPSHNHAFVKIEGESTGNEYAIPAHVDPKVMDAISSWIQTVE